MAEVLQRVSVDKAPSGGVTLAQIVRMLQADAAPRAAVALQTAAVKVEVTDCTLCLIFVVLVPALCKHSALGPPHTCNKHQGSNDQLFAASSFWNAEQTKKLSTAMVQARVALWHQGSKVERLMAQTSLCCCCWT